MKLTAACFLQRAEAEANGTDYPFDKWVEPSESLAKSAALEAARREIERLQEAESEGAQ